MDTSIKNCCSRIVAGCRFMAFAALAFFAYAAFAQEQRREAPSNVFAGMRSVVTRKIAGVAEGDTLSFRIAKSHRTLQRGSVVAGEGGVVNIPVALPGMRQGLAMQLELYVSKEAGEGAEQQEPVALWAFSEQPFADGTLPVRAEDVKLYDPDGKTAAALESIKVPFRRIRDFAELADTTNSFVIVHEGFSLSSAKNFGETIGGLLDNGNDVIVLAPADGSISIPVAKEEVKYGFANDVLCARPTGRGMSCDLDFTGIGGSRFALSGDEGGSLVEVGADGKVEAAAWGGGKGRGKAVVCGLSLIADWEKTPAARWLLADLLRRR